MATMTAVICVFCLCITLSSAQHLRQYINTTLPNQGICRSRNCPTLRLLKAHYKDCIVVIGTLKLAILEKTEEKDFHNISFPNLREVTEAVIVYRAIGLLSLGQLFPNLARIRGETLLYNYGLAVHDMDTLREIGLYGLMKIDRGGVIISMVPNACFVNTVDWETIAPRSRLVISPQDPLAVCKYKCSCTLNKSLDNCWNNKVCQIYLEGEQADSCHEQCLGCRKTKSDVCFLCRHYTHNGICVTKCPSNTIILPSSQYCITNNECHNLHGWIWNNTCVFHCPLDYIKEITTTGTICTPCLNCHNKTCGDLYLISVAKIQEAEGCVFINGSLEIHIRPVPDLMDELKTYLNRIQEVSDYINIYSSSTITSLDFLPSLKRIRGRNLKYEIYSLMIHGMDNLNSLFTLNVTSNLKVDRGTLTIYNNPKLRKSQIDTIIPLFPDHPKSETDIPTGMNGYSAGYDDAAGFQMRIVNDTSILIMFPLLADPDAHYSVLYARLLPGTHQNIVPESCSESEWHSVNAEISFGHQFGIVDLTYLKPASNYAICVETYDPVLKILARSAILNFTTPGKPEPPFITQLAASDMNTATISWVDHKEYSPLITYYEIDVSLLEIREEDIGIKDQCRHIEYTDHDIPVHSVAMRSPPGYARECITQFMESSTLATVTFQEHFDVCSTIGCDHLFEDEVSINSSFGKYVRTLYTYFSKNLTDPKYQYEIQGLAPFRDYRFRLRACTSMNCSRSAREVIRTLPLDNADVPAVVKIDADEHGNITIKWNPPEVTNGPILSFSIEVVPIIEEDAMKSLQPQTWCVLGNATSLKVKTVSSKSYHVRVCTRSMASNVACTNWEFVAIVTISQYLKYWCAGIVFAISLYIASIVVSSMVKRRHPSDDLVPILDMGASFGESEPPSKMFSDFAPMYEVPLRDTR